MRAPPLVAHAARSVAARDRRRLVVGLGTGWYQVEHDAFGVVLPSYRHRVELLSTSLDAVASLVDPRPSVLCGGTGRAVIELAAQRADAWNVAWDVPPARFAELSAQLDEACERAGRDPSSVSRSVGLTVLVGSDDAALDGALERLRHRVPFLRDLDRGALEQRIISGTPETCAERIAAYGADEAIAALLLRDDPEMLDLLGERVAPLLRSAPR
jgi:alkanesulfonate monooxygenase SsuD/methylene tetrahydromethanopterin reductase-like flavin-dependent oxidoreductase (luciferase family)